MILEQLVEKFSKNPSYYGTGAGKLAKKFKCDKQLIYDAKAILSGQKSTITKKTTNHARITPKILIFDIETSPIRAYVWSRWKQNIYLENTISEWFMLTWAAKWLGGTDVFSDRLIGSEVLNEDDSRISKSLWELIDEADYVVAHNAAAFDVKKMNSRFIVNGMNPPSPYKIIDTKIIAQKSFGFSSNKLDALAGYFDIDHKLDTDFELWAECMKGNDESLRYMETYNKKDVDILEEVYLRLRPWAKNQPNAGVYIESSAPVCSSCGSENVSILPNKFHYTAAGKYQVYRCECGAMSRARTSCTSKRVKDSLIRPV